MFTNQSILETNADPYPSLISVIGQVPYLEPGQLFFYLFAILIFTFLLGLMNAANTAFENISESNIFQLKKWKIYLRLLFTVFSNKPFQVSYFYQYSIQLKINR